MNERERLLRAGANIALRRRFDMSFPVKPEPIVGDPIARFVIDSSHPCFQEIAAAFFAFVASSAAMTLQVYQKQMGQLLATVDEALAQHVCRTPGDRLEVSLDIKNPARQIDPLYVGEDGSPDFLVLNNTQQALEGLRGSTSYDGLILSFDLRPMDQWKPGLGGPAHVDASKNEVSRLPDATTLIFGHSIGATFERWKDKIEARFGSAPSMWPSELQFLRHVRNGVFHGNEFEIRPYRSRDQIDPQHPPSWRSLVMPSDAAMNGTSVVGGFLKRPYVLPFLADIGTMMAML